MDCVIGLVNSTQQVLVDAEVFVRVMRLQPWSRICDCVATQLVERGDARTPVVFLEQVILSLPDEFVRERLYYVRHLNGDVWDYRRENLRLEALQASGFMGVEATLHTRAWLVKLKGCKSRLPLSAVGVVGRQQRHQRLLQPIAAVAASEIEAAFVYNLARQAVQVPHQPKKKGAGLNVVRRPQALSLEQEQDLRRQITCWANSHSHTSATLLQQQQRSIRRNAQGVAIVQIDTHSLLVDDDAYAAVNERVVPWEWVCCTVFHPRVSLAGMVYNPAAPGVAGTMFVHCNGDALDFRRANLALQASFQPAPPAMRHLFLSDRAHHYVRIVDEGPRGLFVEAAKGETCAHSSSGPYPRDIVEWAAHQTARHLYGASPPVISGARFGWQPIQPVGWVWHSARGLFVGRHYDVAEQPPPPHNRQPLLLLGVAPSEDGTNRFRASYGDGADARDLGTYETPWLAAWTHDAAVLHDAAHLARCPPVAINGVPRPVGHLYCPHSQRSVIDTLWLSHIFVLDAQDAEE